MDQQIQTVAETMATIRLPEKQSYDIDICPKCFGCGMMEITDSFGDQARTKCDCRRQKERDIALSSIPKEFGVPRLSEIKADVSRHPDQQKKIDFIRQNPEMSYFIYGDNGTGKTFLGYAIYVAAIERGNTAIVCELKTLLDQFRDFDFSRNDEQKKYPVVSAEDLKNSKRKWTIFLDEIIAARPTEYAAEAFFNLLKAANEGGHQLVYTCNVSPEKLKQHWSRQDEFWGNSIARRIAEYSTQVNLFRGTK